MCKIENFITLRWMNFFPCLYKTVIIINIFNLVLHIKCIIWKSVFKAMWTFDTRLPKSNCDAESLEVATKYRVNREKYLKHA